MWNQASLKALARYLSTGKGASGEPGLCSDS